MPKEIFDVHYADSRTAIVLEADLERGWKKLQKTYGFFHQKRIPFKDDLTIRTQLSLIAWVPHPLRPAKQSAQQILTVDAKGG